MFCNYSSLYNIWQPLQKDKWVSLLLLLVLLVVVNVVAVTAVGIITVVLIILVHAIIVRKFVWNFLATKMATTQQLYEKKKAKQDDNVAQVLEKWVTCG